MPRRTAHAAPPPQATHGGIGKQWIPGDLLSSDDPKDRLYSEDGLYIGTVVAEKSDENELLPRFIVASLLVGVLLRLIGLIQYTGFSTASGTPGIVNRVKTVRAIARAGSKLALGGSLEDVMTIAFLDKGKRNLAFGIVDDLVSLYDSHPSSDSDDDDPVAVISAFTAKYRNLPLGYSASDKDTEVATAVANASEEYELVVPTIFETTELPSDPRFDAALSVVNMVQRLVSCQWYHQCHTDRMKIGHFPYYKKKNTTDFDYELFEFSAIKLILQEFISANIRGENGTCDTCLSRYSWFTPVRLPAIDKIRGNELDPSIEGSVASLARSVFTPKELTGTLSKELFTGSYQVDSAMRLMPEMHTWFPPWHPFHEKCDKKEIPWILTEIGDRTFSRVKYPRFDPGEDPRTARIYGAFKNTTMD